MACVGAGACHDRLVISFIIPAHDEAREIRATLDALRAATAALSLEHEIVVVADACSDDTAALAGAGGARVLVVDHRHIAATRNSGARHATGDYLVFVDADTCVDATLLRAAIAALHGGAAGGGALVRLSGPTTAYQRIAVRVLGWIFRLTGIAPGCFIFCTRAAFQTAGGFDERYFAGEDVAISRALARQGRFAILRETVSTSARKLRTFTAREHLRLLLQFAWRGRRVLHSRRYLHLWYAGRRPDDPR